MNPDSVSVDDFRAACRSSGLHCEETVKLRDRVFRTTIRTADGGEQEVYGKVYPTDKEGIIRELIKDATAIGLPESCVVGNEMPILLSEPAEGQPLSYVLPVLLLPGVWTVWGDRILTAYSNLGWFLGTQHGKTAAGTVELLDEGQRSKFRRRTSLVQDEVPELTDTKTDHILDKARETTVREAIAHSDPSPHNIFYKAGNVTVIDNSFSQKAAAQDPANVFLGSWLMIDRLRYPETQVGHQIETAFWKGYSPRGVADSVDRTVVSVLLLRKYLSLVEYYRADPEILHARITCYMDRSAIIRGIQRELGILVENGVCDSGT